MNHRPATILFCFLVLGVGCAQIPKDESTSEQQQHVQLMIEKCSAGYDIDLSAEIKSNLLDYIFGNFAIKASLQKSLKGHFLSKANVTEDNAVELYKSYLRCIESDSSKEELLSILSIRRDRIIDKFREFNKDEYITNFNKLYNTYTQALIHNKSLLAHETNREIFNLLVSFVNETKMPINDADDNISSSITFDYSSIALSQTQTTNLLHAVKARKEGKKRNIEKNNVFCSEIMSLWSDTTSDFIYHNSDDCYSNIDNTTYKSEALDDLFNSYSIQESLQDPDMIRDQLGL